MIGSRIEGADRLKPLADLEPTLRAELGDVAFAEFWSMRETASGADSERGEEYELPLSLQRIDEILNTVSPEKGRAYDVWREGSR